MVVIFIGYPKIQRIYNGNAPDHIRIIVLWVPFLFLIGFSGLSMIFRREIPFGFTRSIHGKWAVLNGFVIVLFACGLFALFTLALIFDG